MRNLQFILIIDSKIVSYNNNNTIIKIHLFDSLCEKRDLGIYGLQITGSIAIKINIAVVSTTASDTTTNAINAINIGATANTTTDTIPNTAPAAAAKFHQIRTIK